MSKIVNKFWWEIMWSMELNNLILFNIKKQLSDWKKVYVICSALNQVTNKLLSIIQELPNSDSLKLIDTFIVELLEIHISHAKTICNDDKNIEKLRNLLKIDLDSLQNSLKFVFDFWHVDFVSDRIVSFWEKLSTHVLKIFLEENWISVTRFTWEELWIKTDNNYTDANILFEESNILVKDKLKNVENLVLISWFTWIDEKWRTTTLWRWWTDTTACFIWNVVNADKVILWKNINWVLTSDPRIVKEAKTIDYLNYDEAEESWKVVCSKAIEYLRKNSIKMEVVYIKDEKQKTVVGWKQNSEVHIKLISYVKDCSLLTVRSVQMTKQGFLHQISSIFHEFEVNMSFIRNTRDTMYISIENNQNNIPELFEKLKTISHLSIDECSIINIIWKLDWDIAMEVNRHLRKISSNSKIWVFPHENCSRLEAIVNGDELKKILNNFHSKFILSN